MLNRNQKSRLPENPNLGIQFDKTKGKEIWFAGGCFWGIQAYFDRIYGVYKTTAGYANGQSENPSYYDIDKTGHAETISISYDPDKVDLRVLIEYFFKVIDPTTLNKQGNDIGTQYRSGIYYKDHNDLLIIQKEINKEQKKYNQPIVTEVKELVNFYAAEDYHQKYLDKNPGGYCHVDFSSLDEQQKISEKKYLKPDDTVLRTSLSEMQYAVTQKNHTEAPFKNEFWDHFDKGIYVDIVTGEPLFISSDKFESGCGWPSFSKPVIDNAVKQKSDNTFGMRRVEVRSNAGDSHLGHVFPDGPKAGGGLRYCINSASLRFIPLQDMEREGYGDFIDKIK